MNPTLHRTDFTAMPPSTQGDSKSRSTKGSLLVLVAAATTIVGDTDALAMAAYALVVPLVHEHLRRDLEWSAQHYRRWLESALVRLLLEQ